MDGFQKFVENIWKSSTNEGPNALLILMNKLRLLKKQIRIWNKDKMGCRRKEQHQLKKDLGKMESDIDSGRGNDELVKKRLETIHQIQKLDRLEALETAQKVKIKWAIDDDENTGFYHGIINKRRNSGFPNQLDSDHDSFLEGTITNAEIKKACGSAVYALEKHKKITVGEKLAQFSLVYSFRRVPRGGAESSQVEELKRLIQPVTLKQGKDSWNWSLSKSGIVETPSKRDFNIIEGEGLAIEVNLCVN
ncbi:hypothetical protein Tco_0174374 [Tanacetum coccineum]